MPILEPGEHACDGRYVVDRMLGLPGSIGEGYLCRDRLLLREVVCKVSIDTSDGVWSEFRQQFERLLAIRSPSVIQAIGFDQHGDHAVTVLEWIGGIDLDAWIPGQPLEKRLEALAQIARGLLSLHAAGLSHGDLWGGVNVLVESRRGCVLIDPQPDLWGSISASTERRQDTESLAYLIRMLAPEYARTRFAPLIAELERHGSLTSVDATARLLTSAAKEPPIIAGIDETFRAAGARFKGRVQEVNSVYARNRVLRSLAINELGERLEALCEPFDLPVRRPKVAENLEEARDSGSYGKFLARHIECFHPLGERTCFAIHFDEADDFEKPWPYGEHVLAVGDWNVAGGKGGGGRIILEVQGDGTTRFVADRSGNPHTYPPPPKTPDDEALVMVDDEWLRQRIAKLAGA